MRGTLENHLPIFFENQIFLVQLLSDSARSGCNDARSVARTDAHTQSQKNVSNKSSSLQVGFAVETLV